MELFRFKNTIHPTAILEGNIQMGEGNEIGPHVILKGNIILGNQNRINAGVSLTNNVIIGNRNNIYPYVSIGALGEMGPKGDRFIEEGKVFIGHEVTIREFVCIHSPVHTLETRIQDQVYLMNKSYVAHDCQIGKGTVLSAGVLLGGQCEIAEFVTIGLGATVHQRIHIGKYSMIGMQTVITRNILPYAMVAGNPARILRFNRKPVERGFDEKWLLEMEAFFTAPGLVAAISDNPMMKDVGEFLQLHPDSLMVVKHRA